MTDKFTKNVSLVLAHCRRMNLLDNPPSGPQFHFA
jgi:hypothetical protein